MSTDALCRSTTDKLLGLFEAKGQHILPRPRTLPVLSAFATHLHESLPLYGLLGGRAGGNQKLCYPLSKGF